MVSKHNLLVGKGDFRLTRMVGKGVFRQENLMIEVIKPLKRQVQLARVG